MISYETYPLTPKWSFICLCVVSRPLGGSREVGWLGLGSGRHTHTQRVLPLVSLAQTAVMYFKTRHIGLRLLERNASIIIRAFF